jgi:hypothetical protein
MNTQNTKTKPASFVRNIQAIWSNTRTANTNAQRPNAHQLMSHKDQYASDRATD